MSSSRIIRSGPTYSSGTYTTGHTYSSGSRLTPRVHVGSTSTVVGSTSSIGQTYSTTGTTYRTQSNYVLTDEQIKDAFAVADQNNSGSLTAKEMSCAVIALGYSDSESECARLIQNNKVSYAEFASIMRERSLRQDDETELRKLFNMFDVSKTGKISFRDLKTVADELEEDCSDEVLREMIGDADVIHHDGEVDFAEFCKIMRHSHSINGGYLYSYQGYTRPAPVKRTIEVEQVSDANVSVVAIRADGKGELYTEGGDGIRAHATKGTTGSRFEILDGSDTSPGTSNVVIFGNGNRSITVNPNNASAPLTLQPQTQVGDSAARNRAFEVVYEGQHVWFRSIAHPDHWLKVTSDNRLTLVPRAQRDNSSKFWMRMV